MSIAAASASSRSVGRWTCRRPRIYRRATGERSARDLDDERLLGAIGELHQANYFAYGSRRMWKARLRKGERVGLSKGLGPVSSRRGCGDGVREHGYEHRVSFGRGNRATTRLDRSRSTTTPSIKRVKASGVSADVVENGNVHAP